MGAQQPATIDPTLDLCTHYSWVDRGSVEYEVCPTLLYMAGTGNRTPDLDNFITESLALYVMFHTFNTLTLTVLVTAIDALRHFETG